MCSDDGDDDIDVESSTGRDIRSWGDGDVHWVTDELAQRIQAAAAAAAALNADRELSSASTDVPTHSQLMHTVQPVSYLFVLKFVNRYCIVLLCLYQRCQGLLELKFSEVPPNIAPEFPFFFTKIGSKCEIWFL